jgi:hypothetical protein
MSDELVLTQKRSGIYLGWNKVDKDSGGKLINRLESVHLGYTIEETIEVLKELLDQAERLKD